MVSRERADAHGVGARTSARDRIGLFFFFPRSDRSGCSPPIPGTSENAEVFSGEESRTMRARRGKGHRCSSNAALTFREGVVAAKAAILIEWRSVVGVEGGALRMWTAMAIVNEER